MPRTLIIDQGLFRDSGSHQQFLEAFRAATSKGLAVIVAGDVVIGSAASADYTKALLAERLFQNPQAIEALFQE